MNLIINVFRHIQVTFLILKKYLEDIFGDLVCLGRTGDVTLIVHLVSSQFIIFNELISHSS